MAIDKKQENDRMRKLVKNLLTIGVDIQVETLMSILSNPGKKRQFTRILLNDEETRKAVMTAYTVFTVAGKIAGQTTETLEVLRPLDEKVNGLYETRHEVINLRDKQHIMLSDMLLIREYADRANDLKKYIKENVIDAALDVEKKFNH